MNWRISPLIVVSNTTPISELAKIGRLNLLRDVYSRLFVPREVYDEVTTGKHPAVTQIRIADWIELRPVGDAQKVLDLHAVTQLGLGECAAMILAEEIGAHRLLIDDRAARREAQRRGLPLIGTLGTLLLAKQRGLIPHLKEPLDDLIAHGARISEQLYRETLAAAHE